MVINVSRVIDQADLPRFEKVAVHRLIRKLDRRLLPYMFLIEIASCINRISTGRTVSVIVLSFDNFHLGHVKLMDISIDLNATETDDKWSISLFYCGYVSKQKYSKTMISHECVFFQFGFAIPSNILMRYIGPTSYLSLSMIVWGSLTVGMAFIKNALHLKVLRFLLVSDLILYEEYHIMNVSS